MKKNNLLIILLIGVFGLLFNINVNALSIEFGKETVDSEEKNVVHLPVKLSVDENDVDIKLIEFACKLNNGDVDCEFVKNDSIVETKGTSYSVFTYAGENGTFPKETIELGYLKLTNQTNAAISSKDLSVWLGNVTVKDVNDNKVTISYPNADKCYKLSINAKAVEKTTSSDARLKDISTSKGTLSPVFDKDVYDYVVYGIEDTINSIKFTIPCNDGECDATISGGKSVSNKTVTLNQGKNDITITVRSSDFTNTITYNVTVYRGETYYNSAKLASLSFGDYILSPAFNSSTFEYTLNIPYSVNGISNIIKYAQEDENATVKLEGVDNFKVGENVLKINVTNVGLDTTKVYTVKINRFSNEVIEVKKYVDKTVTFSDSNGDKTMSINEFKLIYPSYYEKIEKNEIMFDKDGNVTDKVEDSVDISLKEDQVENKKGNNILIIIAIILGGLIIIGVAGFFIFRKPKEKVVEDKKEEAKEEDEIKIEKIEETPAIGEDFTTDLTVSVDEALNDLMNTKQYTFTDDDLEDK